MTEANPNLTLDLAPTTESVASNLEMSIRDVFYERVYCFSTNGQGYNIHDRAKRYGLPSHAVLRKHLLHNYPSSLCSAAKVKDISLNSGFTLEFIQQVLTFTEVGAIFKLGLFNCLNKVSTNANPAQNIAVFRLGHSFLNGAEIFAERCLIGSSLDKDPLQLDRASALVSERIQHLQVTKEAYYRMLLGLYAPEIQHPFLQECVALAAREMPYLSLSTPDTKRVIDLVQHCPLVPTTKSRNQPQRIITAWQLDSYEKMMSKLATGKQKFIVFASGKVHAHIYKDKNKFKVYEKTEKDGRVRNVYLTIDNRTLKCPLDVMVYMQHGASHLCVGDILCHQDGDVANNAIHNLKVIAPNSLRTTTSILPDADATESHFINPAQQGLVLALLEALQNPKGKLLFEITETNEIRIATNNHQIKINRLDGFDLEKWLRHVYLA